MKKVLNCFIISLSFFSGPTPVLAQDTLSLTGKILFIPPTGASETAVDEEGNIFILSTGKNKLYKYFYTSSYDSCISIGGKGIDGEGLNQPINIQVVNRQSAYLLDQANRRLLVMNTNLKIVRSVNFMELDPANYTGNSNTQPWITDYAITGSGDLFLLNQEDNRVLKVDIFGKLQTVFGGLDYGNGALYEPEQMRSNGQNQLCVSEPERNRIQLYDLFGIYLFPLIPPKNIHWTRIATSDDFLICYNQTQAWMYHFRTRENRILNFSGVEKITDLEIGPKGIYLLDKKGVFLYPL